MLLFTGGNPIETGFVKQTKGKDFKKLPESADLEEQAYLCSIKYDGHYMQIEVINGKVRFFTSSGKEFYVPELADILCSLNNARLEVEFLGTGKGKYGDGRTKCGSITTWRTEFAKGIKSSLGENTLIIHDLIIEDMPAIDRVELLEDVYDKIQMTWKNLDNKEFLPCPVDVIEPVVNKLVTINEAHSICKILIEKGYEGIYLRHIDDMKKAGKRVNTAIKVKYRETADLLCVDVTEGTGKYKELIGALILEDSKGKKVQVGSGLTDVLRTQSKDFFVGKVVEIGYEQLLDTYIQPTFIQIREDKNVEDID